METTPISSSSSSSTMTMGDGNSPPAADRPTPTEDYASWTWRQKFEDIARCDPARNIMPKHPEHVAYMKAKMQELFSRYVNRVFPKLLPVLEKDSVKEFYQVCKRWGIYMGLSGSLYPEILCSMASYNALRCARVALEGADPDPLRGRRADPNGRHRYGFWPLHMAAETFSVDMVRLLFQHGASANLRTEGEDVIEGFLPLHVAVENASMHKYLEDHWDDGDPVDNLIFLLCLPEMEMFLDTTRLIAKHTDNIVDEVLNYIDQDKIVQAAILLLTAQKQLRDPLDKSSGKVSLNGVDIVKSRIGDDLDALHREMLVMVKEGKNGKALKQLKDKKEALLTTRALVGTVHNDGKAGEAFVTAFEVSLNGFDIVKSRIDEALDTIHREGLAMVKEGKKGKALKKLKDRKEALLTAHAVVGIVHKAGEALERYIQTHSQVTHDEILEHVSSILKSSGIVPVGKGIDTANLECYKYGWGMSIDRSGSQRVDSGETNEADKSSSLKDEVSKRILGKRPPKGLALKEVRNMFFPYWKSVLSCRSPVKFVRTCQPSRKDLRAAASSKGTKSITNKSMGNLGSMGWPQVASNYGCRRMFCVVASMSRKVLKRA
ncbi:uncharacterized protein LOC133917168 isoform X2 [Phragmites australis]|uniref:uncharacterized protein LOC133917168 isoform X2 n=1 Tax=Phragmites australis TaxID=29695 RepID=UPI002D76C24E|nr:uncharacterized protein LOC133917168 isoform X2 [Phragmites australis]